MGSKRVPIIHLGGTINTSKRLEKGEGRSVDESDFSGAKEKEEKNLEREKGARGSYHGTRLRPEADKKGKGKTGGEKKNK